MIDVCFGGSEAGEITYNLMKIEREITALDIEDLKQRAGDKARVVDLFFPKGQGKYCPSKQMCCLSALLDLGDISGDNVLEKQADMLSEWGQFIDKQEKIAYRDDLLNCCQKIINAAKKGETIRLWHTDFPYSWCGYYFILSKLAAYNPTVISLYMPYEETQPCRNYCNRWLDEFKQNFLSAAKLLTKDEIEAAAGEWERLTAENKRLRVDSQKGIISVDEDYFDDCIFKHMPHGEVKLPRLIGSVLGEYKIADAYIQRRIYRLVDDGILEITGHYNTTREDFNPDYHCYLRRVMSKEERESFLSCEIKENKIIDICVTAGEIPSLHSYLITAKRIKERYHSLVCSDEEAEKLFRERRNKLFEAFIDNKYFDASLVEKMLSFDNVFCNLDLNLPLSNISDDKFYDGRLAYVYNEKVIFGGGEEEDAKNEVEYQLQLAEKVIHYAKQGYTLRFWCSYHNEELCTLYYFMNRLRGIDCSMILMNLPRRIRKENGRWKENLRRWGQVSRTQIGFAISQCQPHFITAEEKEGYARIWDRLKAENGKVRITENGKIKSVPIDYYFGLIERNCPKGKPFKMVRLLGKIIKEEQKYQLDFFPEYFWVTQLHIMMQRGILRKIQDADAADLRLYNCWLEYVEKESLTVSNDSER